MQLESDLARLLKRLICALVDEVEEVQIYELPEIGGVTFTLQVAISDIGKVIGKQGRMARSLRQLLSAMGMKAKMRYTLNIVEVDKRSAPLSDDQ